MNDTPDLEAAFEQASETLTSEEVDTEESTEESHKPEKAETEEKPEETPEESKEESKDESKEEKPEESPDEAFADKGELEGKSPEELEEIYTNWQRAYTQKRQAERQEMDELRKQLEEKGVDQSNTPQPPKPIEEMNPQEYAQYVADMAKEEVRVSKENSYIDSQEKAFYSSDARLDKDSPTYDENLHDLVVMRLANAREVHEAEGNPVTEFDFVANSKKLIEAYDEQIQSIQKTYLQKQSKIARSRTEDFAKETPKTSPAKSKKTKMDLDEAMVAALEE